MATQFKNVGGSLQKQLTGSPSQEASRSSSISNEKSTSIGKSSSKSQSSSNAFQFNPELVAAGGNSILELLRNDTFSKALAEAISAQRQAVASAQDLLNGPGGDKSFSLAARRLREELLPTLTARGVATSGPGIDIEAQKLTDLAIQSQVEGTKLLQEAANGLALLQSMPLEYQKALIELLMNQPIGTDAYSQSIADSLQLAQSSGTSRSSSSSQGTGAVGGTLPAAAGVFRDVTGGLSNLAKLKAGGGS